MGRATGSALVTLCLGRLHGTADVSRLCSDLAALLAQRGPTLVIGDVTGLDASLCSIDALAHLALVARRLGCRFVVRNCSRPLRQLLALTGLTEVIGSLSGLPLHCWRQPEQRKQPWGVEKRGDAHDLPG